MRGIEIFKFYNISVQKSQLFGHYEVTRPYWPKKPKTINLEIFYKNARVHINTQNQKDKTNLGNASTPMALNGLLASWPPTPSRAIDDHSWLK